MADTNPCVYQKQIDAEMPSLLLHVFREAGVITPIGAVVLFLNVTFEPSVGISGM